MYSLLTNDDQIKLILHEREVECLRHKRDNK